jgi:hypothetical protein
MKHSRRSLSSPPFYSILIFLPITGTLQISENSLIVLSVQKVTAAKESMTGGGGIKPPALHPLCVLSFSFLPPDYQ